MKKIILSKNVLPEGLKLLRENFDLIIAENENKTLKTLLKQHTDTIGLISFLSDKIDKDFINISKNLRIISNYAVGYNNIDVIYAKSKNIFVTNTPGVLTQSTADLTWALILACARRILESDNYIRNNLFKGWGSTLFLGKELKGSTIGIVGLGRIGLEVAKRAKCFGMKIKYYSKTRKVQLEKKYKLSYVPFHQLVKESDIISVHIPLNSSTKHLFHKPIFEMMKYDAIFINVSRGPVIKETDLIQILKQRKAFYCGLDVYEFEPNIIEDLKFLSNSVLTPHIGSATRLTRLDMVKLNITDINCVINGQKPVNYIK